MPKTYFSLPLSGKITIFFFTFYISKFYLLSIKIKTKNETKIKPRHTSRDELNPKY